MRGDFSAWNKDRSHNFRGALHQQGRVLLDRDWNAQTEMMGEWQETAARDAFGAGVVAVPADSPDSFKVTLAKNAGGSVKIFLKKGCAWADGLLAELFRDAEPPALPASVDAIRTATYLGPPIQAALLPNAVPSVGDRDAVILETWLEELSPFQRPDLLLEPALGGVDTTERVQTSFRLRLYRMDAGDTCDSIIDDLKDDFSAKGKLTAELKPSAVTDGDCPVVLEGGFTGFEHRLYRIEIADTDRPAPQAYFKWSHFNGGLVGTGDFDNSVPADPKVVIHGNKNAIVYSGSSDFYLEALDFDLELGCWKVIYGAKATLANDGTLSLPTAAGDIYKGAMPPAPVSGKRFFRLWNGIERVNDYVAAKKDLPDNVGIMVQFEAEAVGKYTPSDFWTFEARAEGIGNPLVLVPNLPPQGIFYHRVPLAEITWAADPAKNEIEDCRYIFEPLTKLRGCCIDVRPGEDIHRALEKVFDAGGGCICLMPGKHVLRRPINLTGRNSICIHGFGPASQLIVPARLGLEPPFILTNSRDIAFESFVVVNQTPQPIWDCNGMQRLQIRRIFAISGFTERAKQPLIAVNGLCHSWRLEDNLFVGTAGLAGRTLGPSVISGNIWVGIFRGIDLVFAKGLQIERNQFLGVHTGILKDLKGLLGDIGSNIKSAAFSPKELTVGIFASPNAAVSPNYIPIELNSAVDLDVVDNLFYGAVGLSLEFTEHCLIHRNQFLSTVAAATCGIVLGLRFSENRIGVRSGGAAGDNAVVCGTGLVILADAVDCQIENNLFDNVKQGIVFESDRAGSKAITRDFTANLLTLSNVTKIAAKNLLNDSAARVSEIFDRRMMINSSYFSLAKCERTIIQGNRFNASEFAIEWSGTKRIVDFRIVNNAIIGCQDFAIQIEPDDRVLFLADQVDTNVRLIEKNRFEIFSGAVRATIGAVRFEKNDVSINAPPRAVLLPQLILTAAAGNIYKSAPYKKAVEAADIPLARMMALDVTTTVSDNPNIINTTGFSKAVNETILSTHQPNKGDALVDQAFILKILGDLTANILLAGLSNSLLKKWQYNVEGFVINLAGIQNRVVHNHVYGLNSQRPGGVLFHTLSGEIRDNDIVVPGNALLLNGKLSLASGYQGAEIVGNTLSPLGVAGSKTMVYALAIPNLSPGNLFVTDNLFKGSVMIGGDPIAAQGISDLQIKKVPPVLTYYHSIKYDMATYAVAVTYKAFPAKAINQVPFLPPLIIFPIWQTDPHANRAVIQFCQNRVIQGWVGIFETLSGVYWSKEILKREGGKALIANVAGNVMDYGGSVVGHELIITGNYSQAALKFRTGGRVETVANIPAAVSF